MQYKISERCIGCTLCARKCDQNAIVGEKKQLHTIDVSKCEGCGKCFQACPKGAILDAAGNTNGRDLKGSKQKRKVAHIDRFECVGCQNCIPDCPTEFSIFFVPGKFGGGHSVVDETTCLGCESCVLSCTSGAISTREVSG